MGIFTPKGARMTDIEFDADSSLNSASRTLGLTVARP
jgi:hypothetical protein